MMMMARLVLIQLPMIEMIENVVDLKSGDGCHSCLALNVIS